MKHIFSLLAAFAATAALADLSVLPLSGSTSVSRPARAVSFRAVSTNATGTVKFERVTPYVYGWDETVVSTTNLYETVETNLYKTVTNDHVTVWRTRYLGAGIVESNEYASAVNATPTYPLWPDMVVTTNKVAESVSYTNWTYQVEVGTLTTTSTVRRTAARTWTNTLVNATLTGGIYTNALDALLWPGDRLEASGTALTGGEAVLMISR